MHKAFRWIIRISVGLFILFLVGLALMLGFSYSAMPEAKSILDSESVFVEDRIIIVEHENPMANIVLYQGGLVASEAYLPFAYQLSQKGYNVYIPKMPLNLAILKQSAFSDVQTRYPSALPWIGIGHSLGGATLSFIAESSQLDALVFLAAYPAESQNLSTLEILVLSITASNDNILNDEKYEQTKSLLPPHTVFLTIEGGNHANFGHYGDQRGDGDATLSREAQQLMVIDWILDYILDGLTT